MPEVLLVSKPIAPPWTDSNKNLVRDLASSMTRWTPTVMTPAGVSMDGVNTEAIYPDVGRYAPSRVANAGVMKRLLVGPRKALWHFFFAPNPLTLHAGRIASTLRRVPTVHTIASAPDDLEAVAGHLFSDRVVALSEHTARRLRAVGVSATVIPPAQREVSVRNEEIAVSRARHRLPARYVVYPGDLEFSDGARTFLEAAALSAGDLGFVIASRPKTPKALAAAEALAAEARRRGVSMTMLGELSDIHAVIAGAVATSLVVDTLHAKMDLPLVLLESLLLGVPVLVGQGTAAEELLPSGGARAVVSGRPAALRDAIATLADDPQARARLAGDGARWVRAHCAPRAVAARYEAIYDELVDG